MCKVICIPGTLPTVLKARMKGFSKGINHCLRAWLTFEEKSVELLKRAHMVVDF